MRTLSEIHAPMTGPGPSMSFGTSSAIEKMFASTEDVGSGPLEDAGLARGQPVQDTFRVGKEGIAALPDEQPAAAGVDGHRRGVEAHRRGLDEHVASRFAVSGASSPVA